LKSLPLSHIYRQHRLRLVPPIESVPWRLFAGSCDIVHKGLECDIVLMGLECDIVHTELECDIVLMIPGSLLARRSPVLQSRKARNIRTPTCLAAFYSIAEQRNGRSMLESLLLTSPTSAAHSQVECRPARHSTTPITHQHAQSRARLAFPPACITIGT
jgi:hypothetical protein